MTSFADTVSFGGIRESVARDRRRRDRTGVQQRYNPLQVRTIAADRRAQDFDIGARLAESIWSRGDPDQAPARFQNAVRARRHLYPDRVEHHIAIGDDLGEILGIVIDHPAGAETANIIGIGSARTVS